MERFRIGSKYEFCPNGNYWQDVSGIFDRKIYLFCDCNKCKGQVYELKPFNITKKITNDKIDKFRKWNKLDEIKSKITLDNMEKISQILYENKLIEENE
jgi:hypothetical protein